MAPTPATNPAPNPASAPGAADGLAAPEQAATPEPAGTQEGPYWQVPPLAQDGRMLTGAARAIATEIGVDAVWIRVGFVLLAATGWGALVYVATWLALTVAQQSRLALDPSDTAYRPVPKAASELNRLLGVGLIALGLVALLRTTHLALPARVGLPLALVGVGAVVAWHQSGWGASRLGPSLPLVRIAAGLALAGAGLAILTLANLDVQAAAVVLVVAAAVMGGLALLIGPWAKQLATDLAAERSGRIRSEERARMAAHLHDSVLQTLALIQRNAHDPVRATSLARRQERELRSWLYGEGGAAATAAGHDGDVTATAGLRAELERITIEVEELHGVPVELVVVGDAPTDQPGLELAAAAREAMVNAAKHSGAGRIDVFAELRADLVEVFVRDLGCGFDPDAVATDRAGLSSSIRDRMRRVGGSAVVESAPGAGTEIELRLPRPARSGSSRNPS